MVIFYFIGDICITLKEFCALSHYVVSTYIDEATLANFGGSHQPTHLAVRTHTSSLRRWATLANGSKLTVTVKVTITRYVDYTHCHNQAAFPVTSAAVWPHQPEPLWVSHLHKDEPYFKHRCEKTTLMSLNSNCANLYTMHYTIFTEIMMSLFMLQVIRSRTRYAISFQVNQTVLPLPCFCESRERLLFYFFIHF